MSNPNSHDIKVLNGLAEGLIDSADGYAEAAAQTDDDRHRALFAERSNERRHAAAELQAATAEQIAQVSAMRIGLGELRTDLWKLPPGSSDD